MGQSTWAGTDDGLKPVPSDVGPFALGNDARTVVSDPKDDEQEGRRVEEAQEVVQVDVVAAVWLVFEEGQAAPLGFSRNVELDGIEFKA